ncbi:MAG: GH3 auxin-responsive promoter family protein, partial [Muribaculaceae bacterium]|nr:GH3 auxin-responsive promoter family protein [Muribaculaceae bacterium]
MDFTPLARPYFEYLARRTDRWGERLDDIQLTQLRSLLNRASDCEIGRLYGFKELAKMADPRREFKSRVPMHSYEDIRRLVMRMVGGEKDILWRGRCRNFAQSSGTSGGKSKYIPITPDSLQRCHYKGASDSVAHYLRSNPSSRIFSGKAMILGGSFANELDLGNKNVKVGDLSATLINEINPVVNLFRVPDKRTALMADWGEKLPALVAAAKDSYITNISGVP